MRNKKSTRALTSVIDTKICLKSKRSTRACTRNHLKNFVSCKRSQMKIQQMAFMLIAVFVFFVLAGMFVLVIRFSGLKKSAEILEEENAMLLASKLANSPEFSCGEAFEAETNCVDADKVMMLKERIGKYSDFWGVENIEIRRIYPISSSDKECEIDNYSTCNIIKVISSDITGIGLSNFVSLCRKESLEEETYDKCELAKLIVSYKGK